MTPSPQYPEPPADIDPGNVIGGIRAKRMEIMNTETREVWMSVEPATKEVFRALIPTAPFIKTGMADPSMDVAWFGRSPGAAADGPMQRLVMDGVEFQFVALPGEMKPIVDGVVEIEVNKHHTVGYGSGREVQILTTGSGQQYVEVIDAVPGRPVADLPADWSVRTLTLTEPWAVDLPSPTQTYFFMPSFRSFQGPVVDLPAD